MRRYRKPITPTSHIVLHLPGTTGSAPIVIVPDVVRSGRQVCLAISSVLSLEEKGRKVLPVNLHVMEHTISDIKVTRQIQRLHQLDSEDWVWTAEYICLPPVKALTSAAAVNVKHHAFPRRNLTVSISGHLVHSINPVSCNTQDVHGWS